MDTWNTRCFDHEPTSAETLHPHDAKFVNGVYSVFDGTDWYTPSLSAPPDNAPFGIKEIDPQPEERKPARTKKKG